ncbi:MAG: basic amino acid ABC transporter substrate-binding protein [Actinomycetota bacterium]
MRRRNSIVLLGALVALLGTACAEEAAPPTGGGGTESPAPQFTTIQEGVLSVGSCLDYPPFESVEGGDETGFDVDLTEEIASRLGLTVEWVRADFDTIFTAVAGGQFDMVAAASTITEERQEVVDFSEPYYNSRQALTVVSGSEIASTADIGDGHRVGVQRGTTGKDYAEENFEPLGAEIVSYPGGPDALRDLEAGNLDAVVVDEPATAEIIKDLPSLEIAEPIDTDEKYGFAFSKDNPELTEAANGALAEIIADGTYETIFGTYFPGVEVPPEFQASA